MAKSGNFFLKPVEIFEELGLKVQFKLQVIRAIYYISIKKCRKYFVKHKIRLFKNTVIPSENRKSKIVIYFRIFIKNFQIWKLKNVLCR